MARKREYTIYAGHRGGDFTTRSEAYSLHTHCWIYTVYAQSIRQAYFLAAREMFAEGPGDVGIRTLEADWWHRGRSPDEAEACGERQLAPYLKREEKQRLAVQAALRARAALQENERAGTSDLREAVVHAALLLDDDPSPASGMVQ